MAVTPQVGAGDVTDAGGVPERRLLQGAGPTEREVHVVAVRLGTAVMPPALRGFVRAPDLAVPDDVHDAEAAGHRGAVTGVIGRGQPVQEPVDLRDLPSAAGSDLPVPRAAFLVLADAADAAGPDDAVAAGAGVGAQHQVAEGPDPGLHGRAAAVLRGV